MADTNTTNLSLTKPEVGASADSWGTKLNTNFDSIDALFDTGAYLKVTKGGTGAGTAANARTNLGAAKSGANSDITSLTGLTTALSVAQGGTGATSISSGALVRGNGTSGFSAASAADIVSAIGSTAVTNATNATNATNPASGGSFITSSNIGSQSVASSNAVVLSNSSNVNLVDFAVGTTVVIYLGSGIPGSTSPTIANRNAGPPPGYIVIAGNESFNTSSGVFSTTLSGTWRARGYFAPYNSYAGTAEYWQLYTRTA